MDTFCLIVEHWQFGTRTLGETLPTMTSLMILPLDEASAVWNKRTLSCFLAAKFLPTFGSFGLAVIGALVTSVCDDIFSAFKDIVGLTVLHGNC